MVAAAAAGYRAIAFDFRGYGLSQLPPEPEKASFDDLVVDVIGIMDGLAISKVLHSMPLIKYQTLVQIFKDEFGVCLVT